MVGRTWKGWDILLYMKKIIEGIIVSRTWKGWDRNLSIFLALATLILSCTSEK